VISRPAVNEFLLVVTLEENTISVQKYVCNLERQPSMSSEVEPQERIRSLITSMSSEVEPQERIRSLITSMSSEVEPQERIRSLITWFVQTLKHRTFQDFPELAKTKFQSFPGYTLFTNMVA